VVLAWLQSARCLVRQRVEKLRVSEICHMAENKTDTGNGRGGRACGQGGVKVSIGTLLYEWGKDNNSAREKKSKNRRVWLLRAL